MISFPHVYAHTCKVNHWHFIFILFSIFLHLFYLRGSYNYLGTTTVSSSSSLFGSFSSISSAIQTTRLPPPAPHPLLAPPAFCCKYCFLLLNSLDDSHKKTRGCSVIQPSEIQRPYIISFLRYICIGDCRAAANTWYPPPTVLLSHLLVAHDGG